MKASTPYNSAALDYERTALANERTFLAYIRTAVSIAALGVLILHFVADMGMKSLGAIALVIAGLIFAAGLWRFHNKRGTRS